MGQRVKNQFVSYDQAMSHEKSVLFLKFSYTHHRKKVHGYEDDIESVCSRELKPTRNRTRTELGQSTHRLGSEGKLAQTKERKLSGE